MKNYLLHLIFLSCLIASPVRGQETDYASLGIETSNAHIPQGLKAGDKAPDFTGYDQYGKQVTLKGLLTKGPVVLFFYRGNWCPACNIHLTALKDSVNMITGQGCSLVAITPESIEFVEQTVKMHEVNYTVVYDCQEKIMNDYDVMFTVTKDFQNRVMKSLKVDIAAHNGHTPAHLPVTATFIINTAGIVTATHFDPDFHNRASARWMLKNLVTAY